jgi:transcriptional regulator of arginine metabolism
MNIVVIKTHPGMAQAVATGIDNIKSDDILGCVAGDDTIIVVTTDSDVAQIIGAKIKTMMSEVTK